MRVGGRRLPYGRCDLDRPVHQLQRLGVRAQVERRAQDVVPGGEVAQGAAQGVGAQRSAQPDGHEVVVEGRVVRHLAVEGDPHLQRRHRVGVLDVVGQRGAVGGRQERGPVRRWYGSGARHVREPGDRRRAEQLGDGDVEPAGAGRADRRERGHGVAAEREEVVGGGDGGQPQDLRPDPGQHAFGVGALAGRGRPVDRCGGGLGSRCRAPPGQHGVGGVHGGAQEPQVPVEHRVRGAFGEQRRVVLGGERGAVRRLPHLHQEVEPGRARVDVHHPCPQTVQARLEPGRAVVGEGHPHQRPVRAVAVPADHLRDDPVERDVLVVHRGQRLSVRRPHRVPERRPRRRGEADRQRVREVPDHVVELGAGTAGRR